MFNKGDKVRPTLFEKCQKYRVEAESVEDFLDRYYKPERFRERGEEYAQALIKSHEADFERDGYDIISHHDSVTGRTVAFYGKERPLNLAEAEEISPEDLAAAAEFYDKLCV